jgi:imidazolonepropionase-like amidohydrolase
VVIPVARLGGVTRAIVTPSLTNRGDGHNHGSDDFAGGEAGERIESLFGGQAAVIHLGRGPDIVVKPNVAMISAFGDMGADFVGGSRGAAIVALNNALDDARDYSRNRAAFNRAETRAYSLSRADLEALIPVVEGRMPLVVEVSRASDILQVLKLARDRNIKLILDSGEEAWLVADQIAAARVPVILNPLADLPSRFETQGSTLENAARLHRAGVLVAIAGDRTGHYARQARYNAGNAVANGLPWAEALKTITINPARIYGVGDRFGSIEAGKEADLVIWDGDPLEPMTRAQQVFIKGEAMPMTSRQTELRDRYMGQPGPMPRAYK